MKKPYERRELYGSVTVKLENALFDDLLRTCERLNLEKSEVARRCIRVGLRAFDDVKLPGSSQTAEIGGVR